MPKYLKKYNEITGKWEVISPTSTDDIYVMNTSFNDSSTPVSNLTNVLNGINSDIDRLQRNVSWLAEHGGGGGSIGGTGGGVIGGSNYKIVVLNAGISNDTLFVNDKSFSVTFKFTGGSLTDDVEYRVIYDGNYINDKFTKTRVNTNITITIDDIEKYSHVTPHSFIIEAVDSEGLTIPSYTLSVVEASIKVSCSSQNVLTIGGDGSFDIYITNKILNSDTTVKITNTSADNREYNYTYRSVNSSEIVIPVNFYKELIDESLVEVGNTYSLKIEVQTTTSDGTPINATPVYTTIMIQGSNSIVINFQSLTSVEEFDADSENGSEYALSGNINFGFTPYLTDNFTIYYAVQLVSEDGSYKFNIAGYYDLVDPDTGEAKLYSNNPSMMTGKLQTIQWNIPNSDTYLGVWTVKVKCWSSSGNISAEKLGKCRIINANFDTFPTQIPIRGNFSTIGNTQYAYWDMTNIPSNNSKSKTWKSEVTNYLSPTSTESTNTSVTTTMNIYGTNGQENGFMYNPMCLKLNGEAYASIKTDISKTWAEKDGFTISVTFKTDYHPYNDRTVFFLGDVDSNSDDFYNGMKIDLENVYWYFTSKSNDGTKVISHRMQVPIRQNTLNTVDFVYQHKKKSGDINEGVAKIFINGKVYSAVEADIYDSNIPDTIYLGCSYSSSKANKQYNFADVDITCLRIFSKSLNDMELVINSHNARAERDKNNNIIVERYNEWKQRNYFKNTSDSTTNPSSSIYQLVDNDYKYVCPGYVNLIGSKPPLPVLFLDGKGSTFTRQLYESTSNDADITKVQYGGFSMSYYDPNAVNSNGKLGKEIHASDISVSIQGTSTTTLRSKNLEIYFKELLPDGSGNVVLFQPKSDWFPESQFTLKADVVDSSHANNATLGRWINTVAANSILEDNPAMTAVKNNPPKDVVKIEGKETEFGYQQEPKVKHTLEGFQIILMITFAGETAPEMLGIYSFNLGRYSYYNMGLKFFKYFSRRTQNELTKEWEDTTAPAIVKHYDYYKQNETFAGIKMNEVYSFEFGSDADENNNEYNTWSQDDLSIIRHIGSFKFNGASDVYDSQPDNQDNVWLALQRIFYATSRMPDAKKMYIYDGSSYKYNNASYSPDLNVSSESLLKRLSIKNTISYFIIANAFGMVDSLGKNLTLRSWNAVYNNDTKDDTTNNNKWYPCFYDMDTALGLTNSGDESVSSTVFIDKYENREIDEENLSPNSLKITRNAQQENGFGAFNSKLWDILRSTDKDGNNSPFVSSGKWTGDLYEGTWRILRKSDGPLKSQDDFINLFTEQTKECGELLYNLDYNVKYLTKYKTISGNETYGNIEMLHGDRVEYIRNWLKDRFNYLDGIFEVKNTVDNNIPYYVKGYITCGGPAGGGYPRLVINTTSPTIFTVEVGQNGQIYKYFIPAYTNTEIITPSLSSDSKRIGINSTTLLTKIDGLKDIRFEKFESMSLPKFSNIDLSNVTTLDSSKPVDFENIFVTNNNGVRTSDIRDVNLYNANGTNEFPVTLSDYNKLKKIDIRNSCVTSLSLPPSPLSTLLFSNSNITNLSVSNQPYIDVLDFSGCKKIMSISLNECNNINELNISNLSVLSTLNLTLCEKITKITCTDNVALTEVNLEGLTNLIELNLSGCTNDKLAISIKNCNSLRKIILRDVKTSIPIILPTNVSKVTQLDLYNCTNLTCFRFGDINSEINKMPNGDVILDLRNFTSLSGNNLNMQNCSSVKYVKFNNDNNNPYSLTSSFFNGCSLLTKVFGCVTLNGTNIFKGCSKFYINELPDSEVTPMPNKNEFKSTTSSNDGNVTNININTTNISGCFYGTNCNLYDAYYILQKCDNVTNLSSTFYNCKNIKNTIKNSLNNDIFKYCGKVTTMDSLFNGTGIVGILKSPEIASNKITKNGILTPCYSLSSFSAVFPSGNCYIDDHFFYKCIKNGIEQDMAITSISWFTPKIVSNTNENGLLDKTASEIKTGTVNSSYLLSCLPKLISIQNAFDSIILDFNTVKTTYEGKEYVSTNLFYNNTKLTTIKFSFRNIVGSGTIRNIFGGYAGTINDTNHFPQNFSTMLDSFTFIPLSQSSLGDNSSLTVTSASILIGNSFFQKIKHSLVYMTGGETGNKSYSTPCFGGTGIKRYADPNDTDNSVEFPYEIFNGCTVLKEIPAFFTNLEIYTGNDTSRTQEITLPLYLNSYGTYTSMFKDTVALTNVSYLFSNMKSYNYTLMGKGFTKCSLINAHRIFSEPNTSNQGGFKKGSIPYGLFYQEKNSNYANTQGLTEQDALDLGITDETYGIKNCRFRTDGTVIVEFDSDGKVISGGTYSDGTIIKEKIDDYGVIISDTIADEYYPKPPVKTTHSGSYKTINATITDMAYFMEYSTSSDMLPYNCEITKDNISYSSSTKEYNCPDLVIDNEKYNPIKYFINPNFNPIMKIYDEIKLEWKLNPDYDPRRILKNTNYNPYKKKWNIYYGDGSYELANNIIESELYSQITNGTNKDLPLDLPNELIEGYLPFDKANSTDKPASSNNAKFDTRQYMCPPDLFMYCKNNENTMINGAFYGCGGPDTIHQGIEDDSFINYGLYGVIPPYLFEPVNNISNLSYMFYDCKGMLPYKWADDKELGLMYSQNLFSNMKNLKNVQGLFGMGLMYKNCIISETQFAYNTKLDNLSYMFTNTIWEGAGTTLQLSDATFNSCRSITNVSYMFNTTDAWDNGRLPKIMSSELFTPSKHPNINNCERFMYNGYYTSGSVPEFWKWPESKLKTVNKCYYNVSPNLSNYSQITDKFK